MKKLSRVGLLLFSVFLVFGMSGVAGATIDDAMTADEVVSSDFSDVDESHDNYDAITYVRDQGIVEGYDDGTYKPGNKINRAEFTKILMGSIYDESVIDSCEFENSFKDVPLDEWYAKYVCAALSTGVVQGYPDGTFAPEKDINFAEASKIIVRAYDYLTEDLPGAAWYVPYVNVLEDRFAIPTSVDGYDAELTRGEMAEIVYRLKMKVMDKSSVYPSVDWISEDA